MGGIHFEGQNEPTSHRDSLVIAKAGAGQVEASYSSLLVLRPVRSGEAISDDSLCQSVSSLTAQGLLHILGGQAEMGGFVPSARRGEMYSELPR